CPSRRRIARVSGVTRGRSRPRAGSAAGIAEGVGWVGLRTSARTPLASVPRPGPMGLRRHVRLRILLRLTAPRLAPPSLAPASLGRTAGDPPARDRLPARTRALLR